MKRWWITFRYLWLAGFLIVWGVPDQWFHGWRSAYYAALITDGQARGEPDDRYYWIIDTKTGHVIDAWPIKKG